MFMFCQVLPHPNLCYNGRMKIGVFDSGKGGAFVAERLRALLPEHTYVEADDAAHVPYGSRTRAEIVALTDQALQQLVRSCPIIVLACNTASAAAIEFLRAKYPGTRFVGLEPMIKPAALHSLAQHITVLATPYTLSSDRYHSLLQRFAADVTVDAPDVHSWASLIEHSQADAIDYEGVTRSIAAGSDVIVLACTHYICLDDTLRQRFPGVTVLEPSHAIAAQITRLVRELPRT